MIVTYRVLETVPGGGISFPWRFEMDRNGYRHVGKAREALDAYEAFRVEPGMAYADAERVIARQEKWDKVGQAMATLSQFVNGSTPGELAQAMFRYVGNDHRTLQAQTVKTIIEFLKIYQDAAFDLRNEAAVLAAEKLSQVDGIYIPLI